MITELEVEKRIEEGKLLFKILKITGVLPPSKLPQEYLAGYPLYHLSAGARLQHVIVAGGENGLHFVVGEGGDLTEARFKAFIQLLKEAGARLTKINREIRSQSDPDSMVVATFKVMI